MQEAKVHNFFINRNVTNRGKFSVQKSIEIKWLQLIQPNISPNKQLKSIFGKQVS